MRKSFYSSAQYRKKQRSITQKNWALGKFAHLKKQIYKKCLLGECPNKFSIIPSDPKRYCSSRCSAVVSNSGRRLTPVTRDKIALALSGRPSPFKGRMLVPRSEGVCKNHACQKIFLYERWKAQKFCSSGCAIKTVGSRPTSPRAARAKAGIRNDIDPKIYFFSRWEANYARVLNLNKISWVHQPKTFKLRAQNYTPDFYLPTMGMYVEIKNFLTDYSLKRDTEFRELYPNLKLKLILKNDYLKLEKEFASNIKTWEYS